LPLVVIEAMACGCRAVITDLPGLDSWLPDGLREDEFVSPVPLPRLIGTDEPAPEDLPRFTQHLADALSRQLDNAVQCGSAACAADRLAPFSWRAVYERVEEEYFRLTGLDVR
jgi:glycosyltransferase involved in cell wall biosynthesis